MHSSAGTLMHGHACLAMALAILTKPPPEACASPSIMSACADTMPGTWRTLQLEIGQVALVRCTA